MIKQAHGCQNIKTDLLKESMASSDATILEYFPQSIKENKMETKKANIPKFNLVFNQLEKSKLTQKLYPVESESDLNASIPSELPYESCDKWNYDKK